ncbi:MAG: transcription termination/antitermination protein NusG [Clostridia bacterium]|nr:transcription termination/antitermination protein NusG [Clostridia bacterium]MBR0537210.1 transcription termination/antitermination protein NusG [Clostridia bacterium]
MIEGYKWFVVHTYSGYEDKVAENITKVAVNRGLDNQILEVSIPTETVIEIKKVERKKTKKAPKPVDMSFEDIDLPEEEEEEPAEEKRVEVKRKIFPSYVFVKAAVYYDNQDDRYKMDSLVWYVIRNTRGVTGFVGPDGTPVPLSDAEIEKFGVERVTYDVKFEVGDFVTIMEGAYEGYAGAVESIDAEAGTVCVIIQTMGHDTPVELSIAKVQKL